MESSVLVKAFCVVELLADVGDELGLAEVALRSRLSKPTAHRVLQSLISLGYVTQDADGKYRLSSKLRQMSLGPADRWLVTAAWPELQRLYKRVGETVNCGVLRQGRVLYLSVLESMHALRRIAAVHESDPFFCTALGRAIVAHEEEPVREFLLRHVPLEKRTPATVVDRKALEKILVETKKRGYAIEQDQTDLGVTCIAAPIMLQKRAVAAISLSIPSARFGRNEAKRFVAEIIKSAAAVARAVAKHEKAMA